MHTIKFNLFPLRAKLEGNLQGPVSWVRIAEATGVHRNTMQNIVNNKTSTVDLEVMGKLLDFFHSQGMPITIADLFTVTTTTQESQP